MKQKRFKSLFFVVLFVSVSFFAHAGIKIVVLGSSTAQGAGPVDGNNAWVNRYRAYLQSLDGTNQVVNLAKGGYTTCQIMPTDYTPPAPNSNLIPDTERNITKAISLSPNAIIINMPTNDVSNGISGAEQLSNYSKMVALAKQANIPVWVCSTQPHNFALKPEFAPARTLLRQLRDSIMKIYGDHAIDFYTTIANPVDGTINTLYDSGDGVHLNDSAHSILFRRVVAADIAGKVAVVETPAVTLANPVNINFGSVTTASGWNSIANCYVNNTGNSVDNLLDVTGQQTGIMIQVTTGFGGVNTTGMGSTTTNLNMPDDVSKSNFYASDAVNGSALTISGLNVTGSYSFKVFSSRASQTDVRNTQVTFEGKTSKSGYVNAVLNSTQLIVIENVVPKDNGTIIMKVGFGPNTSNYYYLNAMHIEAYNNGTAVNRPGLNTEIIALSKDNDFLKVSVNANEEVISKVSVYNINGQFIGQKIFQAAPGSNQVKFHLNTKGVFVVRVDAGKKTEVRKFVF